MDKTVIITALVLLVVLAFFGLGIWLLFFNPLNNYFASIVLLLILLAFPILFVLFSKKVFDSVRLIISYAILTFIGILVFLVALDPNNIVSSDPASFTLYAMGAGIMGILMGLMKMKVISKKVGFSIMGIITALYIGGTFANLNPGDFVSNNQGIFIAISCFLGVLGIIYLLDLFKVISIGGSKIKDLIKYSLITVAILVIFLGLMYFLFRLVASDNSANSFILIFLNILIVIVFAAFLIKFFKIDEKMKSKPGADPTWFSLIGKIIFYVPCLLINFLEFLKEQYKITPKVAWQLLGIETLLIAGRFLIPYLYEKLMSVKGTTLLKDPSYINKEVFLANFQDLNYYESENVDKDSSKSEMPSYHYGISCWVYLDSFPPNTNASYLEDNSILNIGNKPNILFNVMENELIIKVKEDADTETIVLRKKDLLKYQKWNNIVVNYDGGTLDVFINNELIATKNGVIPYKQYDVVSYGTDGGIMGGICNIKYFNYTLDRNEINWLYNTAKIRDPPVI